MYSNPGKVFLSLLSLASLWLLLISSATAQTVSFDVLLDVDRDNSTGCVVTPNGQAPLSGFEQRVRAEVDNLTQTVTEVNISSCSGGTFAAPTVTGGPHPVGLNNGLSGTDVVELSAPLSALGSPAGNVIALTIVSDDGAGADVLASVDGSPGGGQILFGIPAEVPSLGWLGLLLLAVALVTVAAVKHRRQQCWLALGLLGLAGVVLAANFIVDGNVPDWDGVTPRATDPAGDASNGGVANDMQAFFIGLENQSLFFRIDVTDLENSLPVAEDDAFSVDEDNTLNIAAPGVLANDSDANMDPLTAVLDSGPANAQSFTLNADGSFNYVPLDDFNGSDTFTYRANDGFGDSNLATVTITVNPVNDAPVASDDAFTTDEDVPLDVPAPGVLGNDDDVDNDPLTAVLISAPANAQSFVLNADGSFSYLANADFNGTDSFTYQADDATVTSTTTTVTITINAINDAPVAVDDAYTTDEDTPLASTPLSVLDNDTDVETDPLTAVLIAGPANAQSFALNTDGTFSYNPVADFNGSDSFSYMANDDTDNSAPATVIITVNPVNDLPVAADDAFSTDEDVQLDVTAPGVLGNDSDVDNDPLTAVLISGPGNAQSFTLNPDGSFSYLPNPDFNGSDSFTYQADDATGPSATATVNITVNSVNDAPVAVADAFTTDEDTPLNSTPLSVLDNDTDVETDPLTAVLITGPANALSFTLNPDGSFAYTPLLNFNGSDSFTYQASDGTDNSNTATVMITINPVNDAPAAADDAFAVDEDNSLNITAPGVLVNDADVDGNPLAALLISGPSNAQSFSLNPDGGFSYLPNTDFNGSDSFTYQANDGAAVSNIATVTITINPVNDAPVATLLAGPVTYVEGTPPVFIDQSATLSDVDSPDFNGGTLTLQLTNNATLNDRLAINNEVPPNPPGTGVETSGADVLFNGAVIGTFSGGTDGTTPLVINFNSAAATPAAIQAVVRNLTFADQAVPVTEQLRTVSLEITDGDGGTDSTGLLTKDIDVVPPSVCDGTVFANFCWWLGENAESCDTVCADNGGNNPLGTTDFAGSAGTNQSCGDVMTALEQDTGLPFNPTPVSNQAGALGCASDFSGTAFTIRFTGLTDPGASAGGIRRACACNDQPAPVSISYAGAPFSLPRGITIGAISPVVNGFVASYFISPPLPAGLSFDTDTGVISGTPSVASASTSYTVIASNAGGSVSDTFMLSVTAQPPANLDYVNAPFLFNLNNPIASQLPSFTGQVDSFAITPALPTGLMFNTLTGEISGTPTVTQAATNHTVTATNIDGMDSVVISVEVTSAVACDGVTFGGFCWYFGGNDQSCDLVCSGRGGNNSAGTTDFAGSNGSNTNCVGALDALGQSQPGCTGAENRTGLAVGCGMDFETSNSCPSGGSTRNYVRYTSPATIGGAASGAGLSFRRACACNAQPAPMNLAYPNAPFTFTQGIAIASQTPSVTNAVVNWSISPALPAGLSFSTVTGVISGTPTALQTATNHTVTASNAGGMDSVVIAVTVQAQPPMNLSYAGAPFTFNVGTPISPQQLPTVTGAVDSYSISPALPSGVTFSTSTGAIGGTPAVASAATNYTVTATNTAGNDSVVISVTVNGAVSCDAGAAVVGGNCWYFGANNQSCDTVCSTHGGYNSATESFAGSGGSDGSCVAVLDALGQSQPGCTGAENRTGLAVGCGMDFETSNSCPSGGSTRNYVRYTSPATTAAGSSAGNSLFIRRACACNN